MKKMIVNILATTGVAIVVLAIIASLHGAEFLFVRGVFETLGACIVIHLGLLLTQKLEYRYIALKALLDVSYIIAAVIVFGAVFDWFDRGTPPWILVIMAVFVYCTGLFLSLYRVQEEVNTINKLLKKRDERINQGALKP